MLDRLPKPSNAPSVDSSSESIIGRRLTRRQTMALLGSGLVGTGMLAAVATDPSRSVTAAQITLEAGEPAPAQSSTRTVANVAADLQYDTERLFRFVADEVAYEPYVGALRGSDGTLRGMAGNSVDKALLLAALLDQAVVPYRFAVGPLSDAGKTALEAQLAPTTEELRERNLRRFGLPTGPNALEATPPALSDEDAKLLDQLVTAAGKVTDAAAAQTDRLVTTLGGAIAKAGIELPEMRPTPVPEREQREHVWLQIADGPFWIDLDPSMPGATQKDTFATVTTTLDALGPELDHMVRVTFTAEEASGGAPASRDVVSIEKPSRDLNDAPIGIGITTPSAFESLGITISQIMEGGETYVPLIVVGEEGYSADTPIAFGSNGGGFIGGLTGEDESGDGEALSLGYRVEIISPDADPVTIERTIFDRIDPVQRATEAFDLSTLPPLDDPASDFVRAALRSFTMVNLASANLAPNLQPDPAKNVFFGTLPIFASSFFGLRNSLGFDWGTRLGWHAVIDAPNAIAFRFQPSDTEAQDGPVGIEADLLYQSRGWRQTETLAPAEVNPWLARGVIDQVAERLVLDPSVWMPNASDAGIIPGVSAGLVFERAAAQGVPITVLDPNNASATDLAGLSDIAQLRIQAALDAGQWVIAPEKPVTIDGQEEIAWWIVDPATGHVVDQLEDGHSGASASIRVPRVLFSSISEYLTMLVNWIVKWQKQLACYSAAVGILFALAALIVDGVEADKRPSAAKIISTFGGFLASEVGVLATCAGLVGP